MFEHSIKVPRLYKTAAKISKNVSESKGSIKQLVYEGKHPNIKALYALVVHTFQRTEEIEQLLKKSKLLIKEPRFDPWLAKVLITELLWGKQKLVSQSKPILTILAYEQIFRAHLSDIRENNFEEVKVDKPRYVRINTLKITTNEAIDNFRNEGWILKPYTDTSNYLGFIDAIANLDPEEFMIDLHIPYLLIFPPKTQFYQHEAYKNGSIILQDKASCLPVHILNPEPQSVVLDMCAAPGMKTTHCAAILQNEGKVHAVEISKKRFQTLQNIVKSSGATCVETINADVTTLSPDQYSDVEYILVDPSCSGSGIIDRVEIGQQQIEQHNNRIAKLAAFQITMLRGALTKFRNAKRVVYSTCSIYPEENEDVVRQVLETCLYFKLVPAGPLLNDKWINFGSPDFGEIGKYCLYAKPDIDLSSGFFVAVFERLQEGERNQFLNAKLFSQRMQQLRNKKQGHMINGKENSETIDGVEETDVSMKQEFEAANIQDHVDDQIKIKKKRKQKITDENETGETKNEDVIEKKIKKEEDNNAGIEDDCQLVKIKRKKKRDNKISEINEEIIKGEVNQTKKSNHKNRETSATASKEHKKNIAADSNNFDIDNIKKKKSKSKKEYNTVEMLETQNYKKKHKNKRVEDPPVKDDSDVENTKKKRKRTKEVNCNSENECDAQIMKIKERKKNKKERNDDPQIENEEGVIEKGVKKISSEGEGTNKKFKKKKTEKML